MATARTGATRTPAQTYALIFGAIYLLVGIVGFAFTGFDNFATFSGDKIIIFYVNPLHNLVHIALGGVLLAGSRAHATAKTANLVVGIVLLVVALIGFIETPDKVLEWLSIDGSGSADNFLHLITGAAAVYFGTAGAETYTRSTATTA
jgi:Domain of unknown function (DUF4383)